MELRQIRYFLTVVEAGSISEGARRLHISQPPLSVAMRQLEEELGTELFHRGRSHLTLTDAGRIFYQKGQSLVELATQTSREVRDVGKERTLHLGLTPTTVPLAMPALQALRMSGPITLDIHDGSTYQLLDLMEKRIIDAAVVRTPCSVGSFRSLPVAWDSMVFLSRKDGTTPISLKEAASYPLILYRRYCDFILDAFSRNGLEVKVCGECDDARTAISMVEADLGNAIMPSTMISQARDLCVRSIDTDELSTQILFVWNGQSPLAEEVRGMLLASMDKKKGSPAIGQENPSGKESD